MYTECDIFLTANLANVISIISQLATANKFCKLWSQTRNERPAFLYVFLKLETQNFINCTNQL